MNDIEMIPLGKLRLSEANVRRQDSNLFIEELAANIEAKGLLQNLIVAPAKKRGMFDVTAGGRRLRVVFRDSGPGGGLRWLLMLGVVAAGAAAYGLGLLASGWRPRQLRGP